MPIRKQLTDLTYEERLEFLKKQQQEISKNFQISEEQRQEREAEGEMLDPDDYYYPHEDDAQLKDWEEHEATLNKEKITKLIIKPNEFRFKNNKLILKDYPNLKSLYACGLGLEKVELDCPKLETLNLTSNNLTELDLSKVPNLENLNISYNKLEELEVKHLLTKTITMGELSETKPAMTNLNKEN
jgi:protein phosphatase 1 regulatory subunit 7